MSRPRANPEPGQPRLIRRSGLVECLSVFGSENQVDANTADPAVLAAIGMTPDGIQMLLRQRRIAPFNPERLAQLAPLLGPAGQFLRLEGNPSSPSAPRRASGWPTGNSPT